MQSLHDLVEELYRVRYRRTTNTTVWIPEMPTDMISSKKGIDGWADWKLIERSGEIDPGFKDLEEETGYSLPYSFKYWHSRYYQLDGDMGLIRLPEIPSNKPYSPLRSHIFQMYLPEEYRQRGFLPFGAADNDMGPLCFYTQADVPNADWPIYGWNHDVMPGTYNHVPTAAWDLPLCFSNFRKLLECIVHFLGGHLPEFPELPPKQAGFRIIDPDAAGIYFNMYSV